MRAAGATLRMGLDEAVSTVIPAIERALAEADT
jgi:hypothetical protein